MSPFSAGAGSSLTSDDLICRNETVAFKTNDAAIFYKALRQEIDGMFDRKAAEAGRHTDSFPFGPPAP
jgi:hypothetical protein